MVPRWVCVCAHAHVFIKQSRASSALLFYCLFACVVCLWHLGQPGHRKACIREMIVVASHEKMLCCSGANYVACLKNANSHIKPWPALPELAGWFYSGPGSTHHSPTAISWQGLCSHTQILSLSGLVARSFSGILNKTSPSRLPCFQKAHLHALHTHVFCRRRDFL